MPVFPNLPSGTRNPRQLKRRITARWSPHRAWHGQEVDLIVEAELIPDGTPVTITLLEEGETDEAKKIQQWTETLDGSRIVKEKIAFDFGKLGYEGTKNRFYCLLAVDRFGVTGVSEPLAIDTGPFSFAG